MRNERVNRCTLAVSTIAAIMLLATTTSMATTGNVFASDRNQVTSQFNDCANDKMPTNVGCQTIDSQIQGDKNSVDLTAQQKFPSKTTEPPPPSETATLIISKNVECADGRECPGLPEPDDFLITVTPSNGPQPDPVPGSSEDTSVTITPGEYSIDETGPEDPDGLDFVVSTFSIDCNSATNGPILSGEEKECQITNIYEEEEPPTGFTITGSGSTTGASFECTPPVPPTVQISMQFSAQDDDTVSGTFTISAPGSLFTGEITDGTTDGNTFTLSGTLPGDSVCIPVVVDSDVTISGDCGNDVEFTYRDESAEGTFTGNVDCTLT
jgi:hypothetical protein